MAVELSDDIDALLNDGIRSDVLLDSNRRSRVTVMAICQSQYCCFINGYYVNLLTGNTFRIAILYRGKFSHRVSFHSFCG